LPSHDNIIEQVNSFDNLFSLVVGYRGAIVGKIGYTQDLQVGFGLGKSRRRYIIGVNIGKFFNIVLHDVHI